MTNRFSVGVARERALAAPWKVATEVRRLLFGGFFGLYLRLWQVERGKQVRLYGRPVIRRHEGSQIVLGNRVTLRSWFTSNPLGIRRPCLLSTWTADAQIRLADDVKASGVTIVAWERVEIGQRVRIGANCTIVDADFHPLRPDERSVDPRQSRTAPTIVGDDVFIGMGSIVLKGVTIGVGAVVGAGSVVAGDVPAGAIVAGNPARTISRDELT
ncbi:acyltransferase [Euzebya tangerina]|uniref:acyltransferase n=1 Tax=Euzebya tangerina TaxID=591198 RepID=UPI000E30C5DB|nr:acyltransferase [Euzebya tangerina]